MGIDQSKHLSNQALCKQLRVSLKNDEQEIQICVVERKKNLNKL